VYTALAAKPERKTPLEGSRCTMMELKEIEYEGVE
jgi:hypothetical protein